MPRWSEKVVGAAAGQQVIGDLGRVGQQDEERGDDERRGDRLLVLADFRHRVLDVVLRLAVEDDYVEAERQRQRPAQQAERKADVGDDGGGAEAALAKGGLHEAAAVQRAHRQQVERVGEEAHPAGHHQRVHQHLRALGCLPQEQRRDGAEAQAAGQHLLRHRHQQLRRAGVRARAERQPRQEDRQTGGPAGHRAADCDVKELGAVAQERLYLGDAAKGAQLTVGDPQRRPQLRPVDERREPVADLVHALQPQHVHRNGQRRRDVADRVEVLQAGRHCVRLVQIVGVEQPLQRLRGKLRDLRHKAELQGAPKRERQQDQACDDLPRCGGRRVGGGGRHQLERRTRRLVKRGGLLVRVLHHQHLVLAAKELAGLGHNLHIHLLRGAAQVAADEVAVALLRLPGLRHPVVHGPKNLVLQQLEVVLGDAAVGGQHREQALKLLAELALVFAQDLARLLLLPQLLGLLHQPGHPLVDLLPQVRALHLGLGRIRGGAAGVI
mmetsp:Transcript_7840/g.20162  ORF Transcript_7840/g.20162 Transcript_7840/m.20162 type:complete len:496 (-) Transcript_7840:21-1508(-)